MNSPRKIEQNGKKLSDFFLQKSKFHIMNVIVLL